MLGAHLLFELTSKGKHVKAICRSSSDLKGVRKIFSYYTSAPDEFLQRISWVEVDLMDAAAVWETMEGVEQVYHCAAIVSFNPADAERLMVINPETTANVVNAAIDCGVQKLVHVSSVAALGRKKQGQSINEKTEWVESKHNSAYAKSKYLAELEVWRGTEEGLNAVIVNPSIILGPGKWDEGSAALFGRVANGFKYFTDGVNAYVDVRDVAAIMHILMHNNISSQRYVLVSENKSYREIFNLIAQKMGVKPPSVHARPWMGEIVWRLEVWRSKLFGGKPMVTKETARTAHQMNYYDNSKVREMLNFEFRPVEQTIEDFSAFYQSDNPPKKAN